MDRTFITYYLETNLICFLLVSFILYSYIRESSGLTEAKWFISALVTVQIYCIVDVLAAVFKNQTIYCARFILWFANTVYITIPVFLIIFWSSYVTEHMRSQYKPGKFLKGLDKIIPAVSILVCIISLSTPLTHSTFYLDEHNGYHRTIGSYLVPVYAYLFMIYETAKLQNIRKKSDSLQIKHDANILSVFAIPCILFSMIQVVFYGTTISQVGFAMALMIVFLGRQRNKISRDELTGLNNRREYNYAIDRMSKTNGTAMIVMADVNDFKGINDTYGHLEGDNALRAVAMILRNVCSNRKELGSIALYRYGGDEFTMLSSDVNAESVKDILINAIYEETERWNAASQKEYSLSLSVGAACGTYIGKDIYSLIDAADKEMYSVKSLKKLSEK